MERFSNLPHCLIWVLTCFLAIGSVAIANPTVSEDKAKPQAFTFEEGHMGTLFRITLYADDAEKAQNAARTAFRRIAQINGCLSDYLPESELMRLCNKPPGKPTPVSDDLFSVLSTGKRIAEQTDGAFDITAGHLSNLWRRAKRKGRLPDAETLQRALSLTGHNLLTLDVPAKTVTLEKENMLLDLGGIAKGYAADAALESLRKLGISRAIAAAGGDIAVGDPPLGESGWPVAVSSLDAPEPGLPTANVRLANCGISTSGDTRQFIEIKGKRYSHIVNPRTGVGLTQRIGVTVIAPNATLSDSLATAASVLGWEKGQKFIGEKKHAEGRFVRPLPHKNRFEIETTTGFPALEKPALTSDGR